MIFLDSSLLFVALIFFILRFYRIECKGRCLQRHRQVVHCLRFYVSLQFLFNLSVFFLKGLLALFLSWLWKLLYWLRWESTEIKLIEASFMHFLLLWRLYLSSIGMWIHIEAKKIIGDLITFRCHWSGFLLLLFSNRYLGRYDHFFWLILRNRRKLEFIVCRKVILFSFWSLFIKSAEDKNLRFLFARFLLFDLFYGFSWSRKYLLFRLLFGFFFFLCVKFAFKFESTFFLLLFTRLIIFFFR